MTRDLTINPSEVVALAESLGKQGNQARLGNGCVCQSGCPDCDRLADDCETLATEHKELLRAARALVWYLSDRKHGRVSFFTREESTAMLISIVATLEASNE